jgi:hypothetical protein
MAHLKVDGELVASLLREGGWPCDPITPDTWRSRFHGTRLNLPFFVRLDRNGYITFAIVPFLKSPESTPKAAQLYRRLLELNQDLILAKFSIDDDLDVVLSVEYPTRELDKSEFDDALDAMSYYADRYYDELRQLV